MVIRQHGRGNESGDRVRHAGEASSHPTRRSSTNAYELPETSGFNSQQKKELVQHIINMEQRLFGLTSSDCRSLAIQLVVKNKIKHPFNVESQLAQDWLHGFRQRHPELSQRTPEATSAARAAGFNYVAVSNFFDILQAVKEARDLF